MAQAVQHETGNFFDQYWIVTLCLKEWFGEKIDLSKTEKSNSAPQT